MEFFIPQLIMINLEVSEPNIVFSPSFENCWKLIHDSFLEIIKSSEGIPKVPYPLNHLFVLLFLLPYCIKWV